MSILPRQAVAAFSLCEKIKSGLIWTTACAQQAAAQEGLARQGAMALVESLLGMVMGETLCAHRLTGDPAWDEVVRAMDKAMVMIRSGIPQEAVYHLPRALSLVTGIAQRAGEQLKARELL